MRQWIKKLAGSFVALSDHSAPTAIEGLEDRRLCSSSLTYGINVNKAWGSTYNVITKMLRDTGTHSVKAWLTINSYSSRDSSVFKYIKKFHDAGYDVTLTADPKSGLHGSAASVKAYFDWAAKAGGGAVDRWEIGNEPDRESPWKGHLSSYVNDLLKPAYQGLHAHGEKVVSGGVSWNPADIKTMVNAGMLNYCDMVGYHPYRSSVSDLKAKVAEVKTLARGKPLVATEWNVRGAKSQSQWASEIAQFWPVIRDNFYAAYYFAAIKTGSMAGVAAVETAGGKANGPFYSAYKSMATSNAPRAVVGPATASVPAAQKASDDANDDDDTGIDGFRLFDGAGHAIKGYSNMNGVVTIKLSALASKSIQIRALTDSGVESVKFAFRGHDDRTENSAPYKAFAGSSWGARKGTFKLSATGYSHDNAKGTAGETKTLTLKFV